MQRSGLVLFLLMCASASAGENNSVAADRNLELGVGIQPCSDWTQSEGSSGQQRQEFQEWVLGFVSVYAEKKKFGQAEVFEWIDSYCRANPSHPIYTAIKEFVWLKIPDPDHPLQL